MTAPDALTVLKELLDVTDDLVVLQEQAGEQFAIGAKRVRLLIRSTIARLEREQAEFLASGDFVIKPGDYKP